MFPPADNLWKVIAATVVLVCSATQSEAQELTFLPESGSVQNDDPNLVIEDLLRRISMSDDLIFRLSDDLRQVKVALAEERENRANHLQETLNLILRKIEAIEMRGEVESEWAEDAESERRYQKLREFVGLNSELSRFSPTSSHDMAVVTVEILLTKQDSYHLDERSVRIEAPRGTRIVEESDGTEHEGKWSYVRHAYVLEIPPGQIKVRTSWNYEGLNDGYLSDDYGGKGKASWKVFTAGPGSRCVLRAYQKFNYNPAGTISRGYVTISDPTFY